jgi:hypothetical protein
MGLARRPPVCKKAVRHRNKVGRVTAGRTKREPTLQPRLRSCTWLPAGGIRAAPGARMMMRESSHGLCYNGSHGSRSRYSSPAGA